MPVVSSRGLLRRQAQLMLAHVANDLTFTTRQLTYSSYIVQYPFVCFLGPFFVSLYILRI